MSLGITESLIILAIIILLFGGKKLPELGKSLGKAITGFKSGLKEEQNEETITAKKITEQSENKKDDTKNS
ncbi:twin-arginine translocase TatA/TatE family subunit [Halobacteriovorax vibrionivorans]|uniref:Sec-independent protein translocase protein TatA n=1 Tax=Halobacteriovorax vibrionivorans TaxID=2152716 RepID=A0ABY0IE21_9BACT|nr:MULTISPECIES: twin-arginine translocase TatA/TatE family subunit [Halobacteriovorax]RZF20850.1 twin-arginine translocase TatA/TatE family subunit [Halobacteriovorax vibrionivorans]TGD48234.1 twin-arginine translocase TatA/TatE family subunit [Halobacteriovorax sp. Y22]